MLRIAWYHVLLQAKVFSLVNIYIYVHLSANLVSVVYLCLDLYLHIYLSTPFVFVLNFPSLFFSGRMDLPRLRGALPPGQSPAPLRYLCSRFLRKLHGHLKLSCFCHLSLCE